MDIENFVLCDMSSARFPVLHASPGIQKMYGGQGTGDFFDMMEVKGRPDSLYEVAHAEMGIVDIDDRMNFLNQEVKNYAQTVLQEQPEHALLFINQKSSGEVFTCEMQIEQKHHPEMGWSYLVATHRDVTSALPVSDVLEAARSPSSYKLLRTQWAQQRQPSRNSDREFHQIVHAAWREKISKTLVDENSCGKPQKARCAEVETIASVSTACSMSSLARGGQTATSEDARNKSWAPGLPCFHLGALACSTDDFKRTESTERSTSEDRERNLFVQLDEHELGSCTEELPEPIACSPLKSLLFSFFILDPRHEELPIVLGSHKFANDAGNDFLLSGFDSRFLNAKASASTSGDLRVFWAASRKGQFIEECTGDATFGEVMVDADLQSKSGELVPCVVTLKQVELDDDLLIAGVSHPAVEGAQKQNDLNLDEAIQVMASEFFFSAPMRRQTATDRKSVV